ncbi:hypothetical protein WJX74_004665 [Apatococcus lobatus]|uniref:Uncharacterized protein n=1 Tax=Apatococcus lobatus TaxID=904363 RepID=A0AAW1QA19_9CHLO
MEDDFLRSLGGPAQGDAAFLEKVARTQKKLGNINVDQMVGLGPPTKLGKGRLASDDDEDDDIFAEFDCNLDDAQEALPDQVKNNVGGHERKQPDPTEIAQGTNANTAAAAPAAEHDQAPQDAGKPLRNDQSRQAAMQVAAAEHGSAPLFSLSQGCSMECLPGAEQDIHSQQKHEAALGFGSEIATSLSARSSQPLEQLSPEHSDRTAEAAKDMQACRSSEHAPNASHETQSLQADVGSMEPTMMSPRHDEDSSSADANPTASQQLAPWPKTDQGPVHPSDGPDQRLPNTSNVGFGESQMSQDGAADEAAQHEMQGSPGLGSSEVPKTDQASARKPSLPTLLRHRPRSDSLPSHCHDSSPTDLLPMQQPPAVHCQTPAAAVTIAARSSSAKQNHAQGLEDPEQQSGERATQENPQEHSDSLNPASASIAKHQPKDSAARPSPQVQALVKDSHTSDVMTAPDLSLNTKTDLTLVMPSRETSKSKLPGASTKADEPAPSANPNNDSKLSQVQPSASLQDSIVSSHEPDNAARSTRPQLEPPASSEMPPDQPIESSPCTCLHQNHKEAQITQPGQALHPTQSQSTVALKACNPVQLPAATALRKPPAPATASSLMAQPCQASKPMPFPKSILKPGKNAAPFKPPPQAAGGRTRLVPSHGPHSQPNSINRASALLKAQVPGSTAVKPPSAIGATLVHQGANPKRPMTSSNLLLPAGKRLAVPPQGASSSALPARPQTAPVDISASKAAERLASSFGPAARCQPNGPASLLASTIISASGISPDPQAQPKEVSAPTKMQGAPPPHSLGHEPVVATAPRKEQQAPALGIKIPDLTDLSLELPAPRSLARDFAGHNKALEQMLAQAHQMQNEVLELRVQTAIVGNEIARLDNPILRAKLQSLSLTADRILASTDK